MKYMTYRILREEFIRALLFSIFLILCLGIIGTVTYAADGGRFGEVLNLILTGDKNGKDGVSWENTPDGTVENSKKFDGKATNEFMQYKSGQTPCPAGKGIYQIDPDGSWYCR